MTDDRPVANDGHAVETHRPFTPPKTSAAPTILIAVAIAAGGWGAYRLQATVAPATVAEIATPAARTPAVPNAGQPPPATTQPPSAPSSPSSTQAGPSANTATPAWTRCQVGERVLYSDSGCEGGIAQRNAHNTQASFSTVPSGQQKMAAAERTPSQARPSHSVQRARPAVRQAAGLDPKRVCRALDEEIRQWDAYARQPLDATEQDRVRGLRKQARDRQFALRC